MNKLIKKLILVFCCISIQSSFAKNTNINDYESRILSYIANPNKQQIRFYWKDNNNKNYANLQNLKLSLENEGKKLIFATNGGMYNQSFAPQGLYIENGKLLSPIDMKQNGYGNFYLQPNGVFFVLKTNVARVVPTDSFKYSENILFATQSGPMLLIDNEINAKFNKNSKNKYIRNGVGILPNGNVVFAMSKERISFYDFANYFKLLGCANALYLDGFVSRTYLPSKNWSQLDGNFAVIIAITE